MVWDPPSLGSDSILWAQSFLLWGEFLFNSVKLKVIRPLNSIRIMFYLVVDSELREVFQPKLYVLHIVFFFPSDHSTHSLVLGSWLLWNSSMASCVLTFSLAWLREVTWVDIGKWCWGLGYLLLWIPFWACFGLGESLHYRFLPRSLHWSPFLPVFGSTLQPYPLLPSNNSKVFNYS